MSLARPVLSAYCTTGLAPEVHQGSFGIAVRKDLTDGSEAGGPGPGAYPIKSSVGDTYRFSMKGREKVRRGRTSKRATLLRRLQHSHPRQRRHATRLPTNHPHRRPAPPTQVRERDGQGRGPNDEDGAGAGAIPRRAQAARAGADPAGVVPAKGQEVRWGSGEGAEVGGGGGGGG